MKNILSLIVAIFGLSACHTMHFTKHGQSPPAIYTHSKWHHIGLLGLVEFSDPVDLKSICKNRDWRAVRVQTGFLQGLVRMISLPTGHTYYNQLLETEMPTPFNLGSVYSPEEVSVACASS